MKSIKKAYDLRIICVRFKCVRTTPLIQSETPLFSYQTLLFVNHITYGSPNSAIFLSLLDMQSSWIGKIISIVS